MKLAILAIALFTLGSQAFACIDINKTQICPGDTVFPDEFNTSRGATVIAINPHTQKVTVRSNSSGSIYRYEVSDLSIPYGCIGNLCLNDTVFPDNFDHSMGATVIAINPHTQKVTVRSFSSGSIYRFYERDVSIGRGCIQGICVKDTVLPDNFNNSMGATVKAVNPHTKKITVRSNSSGSIYRYKAYELSVIDYCVDYDNSDRYSYNFNVE